MIYETILIMFRLADFTADNGITSAAIIAALNCCSLIVRAAAPQEQHMYLKPLIKLYYDINISIEI